jgi:two-component sensor histidine kinase
MELARLPGKFSADPYGLQKLVGVTIGIAALLVDGLDVITILRHPNETIVTAFLDWNVFLVTAGGGIGFVSGFWKPSIAKWVQVFIFFLTVILNALTTTAGGNLSGGVFLIFGLMLIFEYRLGKASIWIAAVVTLALFPLSLAWGYKNFTSSFIILTVLTLIAVITLIILYGAVNLRHEFRHREDTVLLETRVKERTSELEGALAERAVMLQEIHHRVNNNLQVIASILELEAGKEENERARASRERSIQRIYAMALVHETLYRTDQLDRVDLAQYADRLLDDIRAGSSIEFILRAEGPVLVGLDFAVPFGLLLNELATNARKHAFPAGLPGRVDIRIDSEAGLRLTVADNGVGMAEDLPKAGARTLGLDLVKVLSEQLGGEVAMDGKSGTRWTIRFTPRSGSPESALG